MFCESITKEEEFTTVVGKVEPDFPAPPFCMIPALPTSDAGHNYDLSADVYCMSKSLSRIGFFYNQKDEKNFNFAYIHLGGEFLCYSTGLVTNGIIDWSERKEDQCNQVFLKERWINLQLSVRGDLATFYGNNQKLTERKIIPVQGKAQGGLIIRNAFVKPKQTKIYFKELELTSV